MAATDRMRPLVARDLAWIDRAPLSFRGEATTTAEPEAVWAVLVDYASWGDWFPGVTSAEHLGEPREGVGSRRRVRVPGAVFDEEFIAWEPGVRWTFTGIASRPRLLASLVEEFRMDADRAGEGRTLSYTMYFEPTRGFGLPARLYGPLLRRNLTAAMQHLAARAEGAGR
jgi:uncharacterized protein YndB with AHSA1/START domain